MNAAIVSNSIESSSSAGSAGLPVLASRILILTHNPSEVEALKRTVEQTWQIPVVVSTDLEHAIALFHKMALMNGGSLAFAIKTSCPFTRILLVTGFAGEGIPPDNIDQVLAKPFTSKTLQRAVANIFTTSRQIPLGHRELESLMSGTR